MLAVKIENSRVGAPPQNLVVTKKLVSPVGTRLGKLGSTPAKACPVAKVAAPRHTAPKSPASCFFMMKSSLARGMQTHGSSLVKDGDARAEGVQRRTIPSCAAETRTSPGAQSVV